MKITTASFSISLADFPTTLKLMIPVSSPQTPSTTCLLGSVPSSALKDKILTATLSPLTPGFKSATLVLEYPSKASPILSLSLVIFPHLSTDNLCNPAKNSDLQFLKATVFPYCKI